MNRVMISLKSFYQNNRFLGNSRQSNIRLLQSCKVLWIHVIDAICTFEIHFKKCFICKVAIANIHKLEENESLSQGFSINIVVSLLIECACQVMIVSPHF